MSVVDIIADILGVIIGLMIGAIRLVKGVLTIAGRFLVAMTSDPTAIASNSPSQQSISPLETSNPRSSTAGTGRTSNSTKFGSAKSDSISVDDDSKPPDLVAANNETQKPTDLASILQVSFDLSSI